jgi:hypothetical protein
MGEVMKRELPIIQKTYDLVKWYVPILNKLPREHKLVSRLCLDISSAALPL